MLLSRLGINEFVVYADDNKAIKGRKLNMAELLVKMDKILEANGMPGFRGFLSGYQRDRADAYAKT